MKGLATLAPRYSPNGFFDAFFSGEAIEVACSGRYPLDDPGASAIERGFAEGRHRGISRKMPSNGHSAENQ